MESKLPRSFISQAELEVLNKELKLIPKSKKTIAERVNLSYVYVHKVLSGERRNTIIIKAALQLINENKELSETIKTITNG